MEKSGDLDATKKFYQGWISQFGNYPDMKVEGQKRLYLALKKANDPDADGLLKDIIIQNRTEGFDLGIEASADSLQEKIKAENWDDARVVFERALRDFGEQGGLTLFNKIVVPYVHACLGKGKVDLAQRAISFTQDRMTIDSTSQVGDYFSKLKDEVAARKRAQ